MIQFPVEIYLIKHCVYSKTGMSSPTSEFEESLHTMSDMYGQTPPRTRLSRKKRHMKQKFSGRYVFKVQITTIVYN